MSDVSRAPLPAVRRRRALEILRRRGSVACHDVQALFHVSTATARRDIDDLARRGLAVRVHGGAVLPETLTGSRLLSTDAIFARNTQPGAAPVHDPTRTDDVTGLLA
jgi:DeoR/GlpR family transcriptional regulator of sugar metabolism